MKEQKNIFIKYLEQFKLPDPKRTLERFEQYHQLLADTNKLINLVSRKMPLEMYWTQHFLDSLTIMECLDLSGLSVLDFGSGGGLPGIPLKLCDPELEMTLLDSVGKKAKALKDIVTELKLSHTDVICSRLEDYAALARRPSYDLILCRAVAMEERYVYPLRKLLKPQGRVIFYKAQNLEDLSGFKTVTLLERKDDILGTRRIICVPRTELKG
ncbi:MAG TPA: 16S rRNA (guanine(527)-N(7))-methyltransferase RsmG [Candidatus Cloacimonadota bacterium]|nr:16S rRNA (guanine(527)-N(7))-methyltransferase RsmG [Candidatus Cloacimonadota bacterium]HPS38595.1 16S rRNA (guanine(527)-N(7))-methyltransferase RsmG [Candidatus Cloacimonadota bacterium]